MYVYVQSEKHEFGGLWTTGHYDPSGEWQPESDHDSAEKAAYRAAFLNGGAVNHGERIERTTDQLLDAYRELRQAIENNSDMRHVRALVRDIKLIENELATTITGSRR